MKVTILKNEDPFAHHLWIKACENAKESLEYQVIDITTNDWMDLIVQFKPDFCLLKPGGKTSLFQQLYQERVEIIHKDLNYPIFPSYDELRIYENKRYFSYWLSANQLLHPKTWVFYRKSEALEFAKHSYMPIVAKMNIGASGNGVVIIKDKNYLKSYIHKAFSEGIAQRTGPKLEKGKLFIRAWRMLTNSQRLKNKLRTYSIIAEDKQIGFTIFQEFIEHDFEWRAVRIGDSFFAHKKLKSGEKASGSLIKSYDNPPIDLFDFVKMITDRFNFRSVAIDFFDHPKRGYLINEIQCIFGQSDTYQMLVDGVPGRYRYINGKWVFEDGDFNTNESFDLRLAYVKDIFNKA